MSTVAPLLRNLVHTGRGDEAALREAAASAGVDLPNDYLEYMEQSDGGEGAVGYGWITIWSTVKVLTLSRGHRLYDGVLLFAGDAGNVVYGFDSARDGEIVEGDWIGLERHEVIPRGRTLLGLLEQIDAETMPSDGPSTSRSA